MTYADKIAADPESCSFSQYIGAQAAVDPADGTLYVAAERLDIDDPDCTFDVEVRRSQVLFVSKDAGQTFGPAVTVSPVTAALPDDALRLGPGQVMRTIEFPTLALHDGKIHIAWNDGSDGHSHIRLATSPDAGTTWSITDVTTGDTDEVQPASRPTPPACTSPTTSAIRSRRYESSCRTLPTGRRGRRRRSRTSRSRA